MWQPRRVMETFCHFKKEKNIVISSNRPRDPGCLQYHTSCTGRIETFNYQNVNDNHLNNQQWGKSNIAKMTAVFYYLFIVPSPQVLHLHPPGGGLLLHRVQGLPRSTDAASWGPSKHWNKKLVWAARYNLVFFLFQQAGFSFDTVTIADKFARHDNLWA